jgi:hypothetical protein
MYLPILEESKLDKQRSQEGGGVIDASIVVIRPFTASIPAYLEGALVLDKLDELQL